MPFLSGTFTGSERKLTLGLEVGMNSQKDEADRQMIGTELAILCHNAT